MTNRFGQTRYNVSIRKKVWAKARSIQGHPDDIWRRDNHGNVMNWQDYGKTGTPYGWKILSTHADGIAGDDAEHLHPIHHSVDNL